MESENKQTRNKQKLASFIESGKGLNFFFHHIVAPEFITATYFMFHAVFICC